MSDYYTLVREGLDQWINSPDNGGECCQTSHETVDELNRLIIRIKRLEEAGDGLLELCEAEVNQHHLADQIDARCKSWRKAKESKP